MLWHVLSDARVLADCRAEIENLVTVEPSVQRMDKGGQITQKEVCTINLSQVTNRQTCPTLMSTWYEVLRFNHVGVSARAVIQDTTLGGYSLKKNSTVMIISQVIHSDIPSWGPCASEFQHRRFLYGSIDSGGDQSTLSDKTDVEKSNFKNTSNTSPEKGPANRLFGGGSVLCPGRHLAGHEVLSMLALNDHAF